MKYPISQYMQDLMVGLIRFMNSQGLKVKADKGPNNQGTFVSEDGRYKVTVIIEEVEESTDYEPQEVAETEDDE